MAPKREPRPDPAAGSGTEATPKANAPAAHGPEQKPARRGADRKPLQKPASNLYGNLDLLVLRTV